MKAGDHAGEKAGVLDCRDLIYILVRMCVNIYVGNGELKKIMCFKYIFLWQTCALGGLVGGNKMSKGVRICCSRG